MSQVVAAQSRDLDLHRRAFAVLFEAYWRPAYKYLRVKWRLTAEDAQDLTQGFFTAALEKRFFDRYDPAAGSFRTFLRVCLDRFAANQRKAARRLKRGGDVARVQMDFAAVEHELARQGAGPELDAEQFFHREWVRGIFATAVAALEAHCRGARRALWFEVFRRYDLAPEERPTYAAIGAELGLPLTQVTNHLAAARRELRRLVLEKLREATGSDREFRAEARRVLGVDAP